MDNKLIIFVFFAFILFIFVLMHLSNKENLSLSQFPVPTCSTCKSCKFYTCGKCGTVYQLQNRVGQTCDCGGFTVYRTPIKPSCYGQTLKGYPQIGPVQTCTETFCGNCGKNCGVKDFESKSSCKDCDSNDYVCLQAAGTFDSGTTFLRNLPCPVPFPPVLRGYKPVAHKQSRHVSELDIYKHLQKGGLIIGANDGNVIDYTLGKLIEQTENCCNGGYPNFYYINGPIVVLTKVDDNYFWMIDYPIKYNPENFSNYVNTCKNWYIAKTAYHNGRKLLNLDAPFIFFDADPNIKQKLRATVFDCIPIGSPQSNTDYYYPGCSNKTCLWGPDYGSGNWLTRV